MPKNVRLLLREKINPNKPVGFVFTDRVPEPGGVMTCHVALYRCIDRHSHVYTLTKVSSIQEKICSLHELGDNQFLLITPNGQYFVMVDDGHEIPLHYICGEKAPGLCTASIPPLKSDEVNSRNWRMDAVAFVRTSDGFVQDHRFHLSEVTDVETIFPTLHVVSGIYYDTKYDTLADMRKPGYTPKKVPVTYIVVEPFLIEGKT